MNSTISGSESMKSATELVVERPGEFARLNYLSVHHGVRSWLLTKDHKRIGLLYLFTILIFFIIASVAAALMRIELLTPQPKLVTSETYNKLFTLHGVLMVWFFLIPSIPAVLGNFVLPMMIGARDVAFPKLNLMSWYIFVAGGALALWSLVHGGVDTGWTFYTPYSTTYANTHVISMAAGVFVAGFSSIITGMNFMVTIHKMRAPGLTWFRLPLFVWSLYATSLILVLATPVLAITLALMSVERFWGVGIFDPKLGGDPVLFQHLFRFYSHPAVYIMILPGMGVVSELITCFSRKRIFGYHYVAFSSIAMVFSLLSYLVAIPSAVKVFNWTATLHKGTLEFRTPLLYALGFIGLFTIGGLTGLFLASLGMDVHVTDTYFVIAHFHYIMVGGMVVAYMGGVHYWWPKISGRMYPEGWGRLAALIIFVGFNLTFFPQFILGYLAYPDEFQVLNVMSTAGASILGVGYLLPMIYLLWSLRYGEPAGDNPWDATGLEWRTPSPPPRDNFATAPTVSGEPYAYPGREPVHG